MSSDEARAVVPKPVAAGASLTFQADVFHSRQRAIERARVQASHLPNGDDVCRWEFPVCDASGRVMRFVWVNARTEEDAVVAAVNLIDADRVLGEATCLRLATQS